MHGLPSSPPTSPLPLGLEIGPRSAVTAAQLWRIPTIFLSFAQPFRAFGTNTLSRSFRTHPIISVGLHHLIQSVPTLTTLLPTFSEMTTLGPWAPLVFIWGSYLLFYPTLGIAPFLTQMPIVFWYVSHILAILLPFVLRHVSGALCFGTPLRPRLLRCVSQTLDRVDRVERTLLCLHTFDTFVLLDQSFTSFA